MTMNKIDTRGNAMVGKVGPFDAAVHVQDLEPELREVISNGVSLLKKALQILQKENIDRLSNGVLARLQRLNDVVWLSQHCSPPLQVFMIHCSLERGSAVFVKELYEFRRQNGFVEPWGDSWMAVKAENEKDAFDLGCTLVPPHGGLL